MHNYACRDFDQPTSPMLCPSHYPRPLCLQVAAHLQRQRAGRSRYLLHVPASLYREEGVEAEAIAAVICRQYHHYQLSRCLVMKGRDRQSKESLQGAADRKITGASAECQGRTCLYYYCAVAIRSARNCIFRLSGKINEVFANMSLSLCRDGSSFQALVIAANTRKFQSRSELFYGQL